MSQTRKTFFSRTVSITGATAVLLSTLMEANGWAKTDSHEGEECKLQPLSATLYIGDDENVRDAAGVGTYRGFPVASGVIFPLSDFKAGLIDPNQTWLYSTAQDIGVIFQGS
jgi:hypothetical protein